MKKLLRLILLLLGFYWGIRFCLLLQWSTTTFPLNFQWYVDLGISTYERPAYQDGLILFPANGLLNSYWYGIEGGAGQVVWSQSIRRNSFRRCLTSEYLVVSGAQSLLVLNPHNGDIVWAKDSGETATCNDTAVFTVVPRGFVQALDLSNGYYRWRGTKPQESFYGLIYNAESDELIASGAAIINPNSGTILRFFDEPVFIGYAPIDQGRGYMYVIDRGQLFIGGSVRDAKTGQVLHIEKRFGGFAAPTVTEDTVYISDSTEDMFSSGVVAVDRTTFNIKWKYQPQYKLLSGIPLLTLSPVTVFDGIGYAIFSDASLRAFDLETGQELGYWQPGILDRLVWPLCAPLPFPLCTEFNGVGMATSKDMLFVSFGDGKLYAFGK